jgi:hypothetical protein
LFEFRIISRLDRHVETSLDICWRACIWAGAVRDAEAGVVVDSADVQPGRV